MSPLVFARPEIEFPVNTPSRSKYRIANIQFDEEQT